MLKSMAVARETGPETSRLQPGLTGPLLVNAGEQSLLGGPRAWPRRARAVAGGAWLRSFKGRPCMRTENTRRPNRGERRCSNETRPR